MLIFRAFTVLYMFVYCLIAFVGLGVMTDVTRNATQWNNYTSFIEYGGVFAVICVIYFLYVQIKD